ncbi:hypothetical protein [Paraburkholderia humisilvae]|nr:hypothetical protein [Paraburkholderia humisilvae]
MNNHQQFYVVYDGPALKDHRMDVRDLAPALIAIADLLTAANEEINGKTAKLRVHVNASFKAGSFGIDLVATQHLLSQIKDIFSGNGASAVCNGYTLMTMVGFVGGGGLIGLLRRLKGRRPVQIRQTGKVATVHISQTESIEVDSRVVKLYRSSIVRTSLEKVVSPLEQEGITDFGVMMLERLVLEIHDDEVGSLSAVTMDTAAEVVSDTTSHKMLQIESLAFKDGSTWRVHDGIATFHAWVDDRAFLKKIDAGERFGKGDVLLVDLRQVQRIDGGRLNSESTIVKVLEHRQPLQQNLPDKAYAGANEEHGGSGVALSLA